MANRNNCDHLQCVWRNPDQTYRNDEHADETSNYDPRDGPPYVDGVKDFSAEIHIYSTKDGLLLPSLGESCLEG